MVLEILAFIYLMVMIRIAILQLGVLKCIHKDEQLPREIKYKMKRRLLLAVFFWPRDFFAIPLVFFKAYALADKECGLLVGIHYSRNIQTNV